MGSNSPARAIGCDRQDGRERRIFAHDGEPLLLSAGMGPTRGFRAGLSFVRCDSERWRAILLATSRRGATSP